MDATEYQLRHMIGDLRAQIELLEETFEERVKELIREALVQNHLIEPSAEES
jgi:hypothetical protein